MSEKINAKSIGLLLVVAVLFVLVVQDRATTGTGEDAPASPKQTLIDANSVTRSVEALIEERDRWAAAHRDAENAWQRTLSMIIQAPSVNVAESSLRAELEEQMRIAGLTLSVSSPLVRQTPIEGEPLRVIGLTLDFDAANPELVHTMIDRIENSSAPRMVITDLEIRGPGRTGRDGLHIKMDVTAMAWIGSTELAIASQREGGSNG